MNRKIVLTLLAFGLSFGASIAFAKPCGMNGDWRCYPQGGGKTWCGCTYLAVR